MVSRIFVHGPGGSGKTFMLNEVILPVYEEYLPGMSKGVAAQNSAARLIGGSTFHHMAGPWPEAGPPAEEADARSPRGAAQEMAPRRPAFHR